MMRTTGLLLLLLFLCGTPAPAHEGHGDEREKPAVAAAYFSAEALSDKYELLVKWPELEAGEPAKWQLYISDARTNLALDSLQLKATVTGLKQTPELRRLQKGIYELVVALPDKKAYALQLAINGPSGADLLQVSGIQAGKELPGAAHADADHRPSFWPYLLIGVATGMGLTLLVVRLRSRKAGRFTAVVLWICLLLPAGTGKVAAHGDHGEEKKNTGAGPAAAFIMPKETQFLYGIATLPIEDNNFYESVQLYGTVLASSSGSAVIQVPQTGKIISLPVRVGQQVTRGQVLAVVEQSIDAGTQISILTQRNGAVAELEAARLQYERLKTIEDIAARKDVSEAKARYETALRNKKVLDANAARSGGETRQVVLTAPISGIVGNFNFAIGAVVSAGESLFSITDLKKVYVEAQLYDKDVEALNNAGRFLVECSNNDHKSQEVRLLAKAQEINVSNQSQRVLFEMDNSAGEFKIGEFVNVRAFASEALRGIAVPNSAITEINGRPVVFIKDHAEQYSISYVATGNNNGSHTIIDKGIEAGEKVVTAGTYQMKMVYLNQ